MAKKKHNVSQNRNRNQRPIKRTPKHDNNDLELAERKRKVNDLLTSDPLLRGQFLKEGFTPEGEVREHLRAVAKRWSTKLKKAHGLERLGQTLLSNLVGNGYVRPEGNGYRLSKSGRKEITHGPQPERSHAPKHLRDCPYCGQPVELVTGKVIYEHREDLHELFFYQCKPCDAYVGCHGRSKVPKGIVAKEPLRKARLRVHAAFDPIWKRGYMERNELYAWLAKHLGLPNRDACHIGLFKDVETCERAIQLCKKKLATLTASV